MKTCYAQLLCSLLKVLNDADAALAAALTLLFVKRMQTFGKAAASAPSLSLCKDFTCCS